MDVKGCTVTRRWSGALVLLVLASAGCDQLDRLGRLDRAGARRAMVAYFDCDECTDGELSALVAFGPAIVPSLAATLRRGPSPSSREILRGNLAAAHAHDRE